MIDPNVMNLGEMHKEGECSIKTGGLSNRDQIAKEIFLLKVSSIELYGKHPDDVDLKIECLSRFSFAAADIFIKQSNRDTSQD